MLKENVLPIPPPTAPPITAPIGPPKAKPIAPPINPAAAPGLIFVVDEVPSETLFDVPFVYVFPVVFVSVKDLPIV